MCRDCGCENANQLARGLKPKIQENLPQIHLSGNINHPSSVSKGRHLSMEQNILEHNDRLAQKNRIWFQKNKIRVLNLISSPGSGKTLLLEKTAAEFHEKNKLSILTGDQEKDFDALRLKVHGAKVKQLNTLSSCHLDASMIHQEIDQFIDPEIKLLIIENVGNLVCPAAFDLGEAEKIALLSTPEGEDKPSKYPLLFHEASLILITKIDLMPHLDWSLQKCMDHIRKVNFKAPVLKISAKTGEGLQEWFKYLRAGSL